MSDLYLAYKEFNPNNSAVVGGAKNKKSALDSKDFIARLNSKLISKKLEPVILIDVDYALPMEDSSNSLPEDIADGGHSDSSSDGNGDSDSNSDSNGNGGSDSNSDSDSDGDGGSNRDSDSDGDSDSNSDGDNDGDSNDSNHHYNGGDDNISVFVSDDNKILEFTEVDEQENGDMIATAIDEDKHSGDASGIQIRMNKSGDVIDKKMMEFDAETNTITEYLD